MKVDFFSAKVAASKSGKFKRKPLRTFADMAEEFGITTSKFKSVIGNSGKPFPAYITMASTGTTWYEADKVRDWWKENKPQ
jgi:hypothetical protein